MLNVWHKSIWMIKSDVWKICNEWHIHSELCSKAVLGMSDLNAQYQTLMTADAKSHPGKREGAVQRSSRGNEMEKARPLILRA